MIMSINEKDILNLFTSDDEISNEIIKYGSSQVWGETCENPKIMQFFFCSG